MTIQPSSYIELRNVPDKGRAVYACKFIPAGTEFETVPVLVFPNDELFNSVGGEFLADYVFEWGEGTVALALGYGSMYNHSYRPNARYDDFDKNIKTYTALVDIHPDEEITINYNGHEEATDPVGFDLIGEEAPEHSEDDEDEEYDSGFSDGDMDADVDSDLDVDIDADLEPVVASDF